MKKLLLALTASLLCLSAFAQGRLIFENDSLHLAYFDSSMGTLAGQPVTSQPGFLNPMADLYVGTSSSLLSLITSTTFNGLSGRQFGPVTVAVPVAPGTRVFVVVGVLDAAYAPPPTWSPGTPSPYSGIVPTGFSVECPVTLGGVPLPSITQAWPPGTYPIPGYGLGAIPVGVPVPSTIALSALGVALILVLRRLLGLAKV